MLPPRIAFPTSAVTAASALSAITGDTGEGIERNRCMIGIKGWIGMAGGLPLNNRQEPTYGLRSDASSEAINMPFRIGEILTNDPKMLERNLVSDVSPRRMVPF